MSRPADVTVILAGLLDEQRATNALLRKLVAGVERAATQPALRIHEVAAELQVSTSTVQRLIRAGRLARLPGIATTRIAADEVARYKECAA